MECRERILKDIAKLENSFKEINTLNFSEKEKEIIERAKNYREDSKYYLEKGDEISSFGCIIYSHGLIDAIRINHELI